MHRHLKVDAMLAGQALSECLSESFSIDGRRFILILFIIDILARSARHFLFDE